MRNPLPEAETLARIADALSKNDGVAVTRTEQGVSGTRTAIGAKWFLGGRKVTSDVTGRLDPRRREVHPREKATESSWGVTPPSFGVETTSQAGARATKTMADRGVGGGDGSSSVGAARPSSTSSGIPVERSSSTRCECAGP